VMDNSGLDRLGHDRSPFLVGLTQKKVRWLVCCEGQLKNWRGGTSRVDLQSLLEIHTKLFFHIPSAIEIRIAGRWLITDSYAIWLVLENPTFVRSAWAGESLPPAAGPHPLALLPQRSCHRRAPRSPAGCAA
jgi:hypothetical protein